VVTAIAFCPSPPLLVPELAAGAAAELDPLRAACREAVRRLLAARPDQVVVIATDSAGGRFPPGTTGTLAGYGVPVRATLPGGAPARPPSLPLGLTLGAWLLAGAGVRCSGVAVTPGGDPAAVAGALAGPGRALLVMGDGTAKRTTRAPGYVDPRAEPYDASVAAALAAGDAAALRGLDPVLGADLLAVGVPAWRVAGHAATGPYDADLLHETAPYGVGYFVAFWTAR
jgi:hypothetical protein